jgi:hypothetical protein
MRHLKEKIDHSSIEIPKQDSSITEFPERGHPTQCTKLMKLETDLWLDYLIDLDSEDETGSFLTPEDLNAVEHAYLRLQTNGSGGTKKPNKGKSIAINDDDEFIKRKIGLALERAIPGNLTLLEETKSWIKKRNEKPSKLVPSPISAGKAWKKIKTVRRVQQPGPEDIDLALTMLSFEEAEIKFRVLGYKKGYLSGQVKVLFPKSKPKKRTFHNEKGWSATIEIIRNGTKEKKTVYTRGLCMNLLVQEVGLDIANQLLSDAKTDDSGITFKSVSKNGSFRERKPDLYSISFVKPGWKTVDPDVAQEFVRTQKIAAFSPILAFFHGLFTKSFGFFRW